jgi:hypothetical protein
VEDVCLRPPIVTRLLVTGCWKERDLSQAGDKVMWRPNDNPKTVFA